MASAKTLKLRAAQLAHNAAVQGLTVEQFLETPSTATSPVTSEPSRYARNTEYRVTESYGGEE